MPRVDVDATLRRAGYCAFTARRMRTDADLNKQEDASKIILLLEKITSNPRRTKDLDVKRTQVISELRAMQEGDATDAPSSSGASSSGVSSSGASSGLWEAPDIRHIDIPSLAESKLGDLYIAEVRGQADDVEAIKVGRAENCPERMGRLDSEARTRLGRPWKHSLMCIIHNAGCLEPLIHKFLAKDRIDGAKEYFRPGEDVAAYVERILRHIMTHAVPFWLESLKKRKSGARDLLGDELRPAKRGRLDLKIAEAEAAKANAEARQEREHTKQAVEARKQARAAAQDAEPRAAAEAELKRAQADKVRAEADDIRADAELKKAQAQAIGIESQAKARAIDTEAAAKARAIETEANARARSIDTLAAADADLKSAQAAKLRAEARALESKRPPRRTAQTGNLDAFLSR